MVLQERLTATTLRNIMHLQPARVVRKGEAEVVPDLVGEVHPSGMSGFITAVGDPRGEGCDAGTEAGVLSETGRAVGRGARGRRCGCAAKEEG